jgi:hypothetical protein
MKNAAQYRALASLARQTAAYNPDRSWQLLGQAERWEHLAEAELASHFKDSNGGLSMSRPKRFMEPDVSRWKAMAETFLQAPSKT